MRVYGSVLLPVRCVPEPLPREGLNEGRYPPPGERFYVRDAPLDHPVLQREDQPNTGNPLCGRNTSPAPKHQELTTPQFGLALPPGATV